MSDAALAVLARYSWPGNVRELRNLIERLMIICPQARIEPLHLPPGVVPRQLAGIAPQPNATLHEARSAYEREFILRKLEENQWNMTRTAEALGLERSHLYRKMKHAGDFGRRVTAASLSHPLRFLRRRASTVSCDIVERFLQRNARGTRISAELPALRRTASTSPSIRSSWRRQSSWRTRLRIFAPVLLHLHQQLQKNLYAQNLLPVPCAPRCRFS